MAVFKDSRYVKTSAYIRRGEALVLSIRKRNYFDKALATYYTVVQGDTLDGIAYKRYGNAQLYWAILDANPKLLSEFDLKPGDVIMIPSFDEVVEACG